MRAPPRRALLAPEATATGEAVHLHYQRRQGEGGADRLALPTVPDQRLLHRPARRREGRQGRVHDGHVIPTLCGQGSTLYLTGEDPPAQVCVPRFLAAGLNDDGLVLIDFVDCVRVRARRGRGHRGDRGAFPLPGVHPRVTGRVVEGRTASCSSIRSCRSSPGHGRPTRSRTCEGPRCARRHGPGDGLRRGRAAPHRQGPGQADQPRRTRLGGLAQRRPFQRARGPQPQLIPPSTLSPPTASTTPPRAIVRLPHHRLRRDPPRRDRHDVARVDEITAFASPLTSCS